MLYDLDNGFSHCFNCNKFFRQKKKPYRSAFYGAVFPRVVYFIFPCGSSGNDLQSM